MLNLRLQRGAAPIQPPASGFRPLPFLIEDPTRILVLSGARRGGRAKDLSSVLIYTLKIRNRRKSRRISHLRFSNRGSDKASASRANNVSRGTSPPFLIYTPKIRNRRKRCKVNHLHFPNLYNSGASFLHRLGSLFCSLPLCRRLASGSPRCSSGTASRPEELPWRSRGNPWSWERRRERACSSD